MCTMSGSDNRAGLLSKTSAAWKYFDANKDKLSFPECKLCKAKLAGGGANSILFDTSNLLKFCETKALVSVIVSVNGFASCQSSQLLRYPGLE